MHVDAAGSEFQAFTFARAVQRFLFCPFYSLLRRLQPFFFLGGYFLDHLDGLICKLGLVTWCNDMYFASFSKLG